MSVYFTSDPHLGHKNIAKFRKFVTSPEENTQIFIEDWNNRISKNDIVYMLGDVAFTEEALTDLSQLRGRKILIKGNHDDLVSTKLQATVFEEIHGILKYKGFWLTHCPIHPNEMRGKKANIHGHVHNKSIMKSSLFGRKSLDSRYFNACVDILWPSYNSMFVSLDQLRSLYK